MADAPGGYTARDAWNLRDGWHDRQAELRWWLLALERRERGEAREEMRARRLDVTVDELRACRARRLAELAADLEAAGYTRMGSEPGDPDAADMLIRLPVVPSDDRPPWLVCALCCRTMHKTKGRRVQVRPGGVFCCRCCASLSQDVPAEVLDMWLLDSREYKRAAVIATYRADPVSLTAAETRAEVTRFLSDSEGGPLPPVTTPAIAAAHLVPVRTFFALVRARGRGVL
jgi:hypothetical protein